MLIFDDTLRSRLGRGEDHAPTNELARGAGLTAELLEFDRVDLDLDIELLIILFMRVDACMVDFLI